MSNRDKRELVKEARQDVKIFARYGIKAYSPVLEEKVPNTPGKLKTRKKGLIPKWAEDKQAMRNSFAIVDRTADMKSEGVQHETGFMRYTLWRPVIRVSPKHDKGYFSIANLEDDLIVCSIEQAAELLRYKFGSRHKYVKWQLKILNRCLLGFMWDHIKGFLL
jgi:hypothetical protein